MSAPAIPVKQPRLPISPRAAYRAFAVLCAALVAPSAQAIGWGRVTPTKVELFYPGQASWEWALTEKDHSGAPKFRAGKNCRSCHDGEQQDIGNRIASGQKLEPDPITGNPGSNTLEVRAAYDAPVTDLQRLSTSREQHARGSRRL